MSKNILQQMLHALYSSGVVFYRPAKETRSDNAISNSSSVFIQNQQSGFALDVPGGAHFHPTAQGNSPYYSPEKHSSHAEIIMLGNGVVDFFINDHWVQLQKERVCILMPNTVHTERHFQHTPYTLFWLLVFPDFLTLHRTSFTPGRGYARSAGRIVISPPMANQLWTCARETPENEAHYFSLLVQCLDFAVSNELAEQRTGDYHAALLFQIKKYIDGNFASALDLTTLAQMAHCSPIHLNRLFTAQFGKTIHQYLLELRFGEAKKKLRLGSPPGEVARLTGFSDPRYFSRFFHRKTGMTPSAYQRSCLQPKNSS